MSTESRIRRKLRLEAQEKDAEILRLNELIKVKDAAMKQPLPHAISQFKGLLIDPTLPPYSTPIPVMPLDDVQSVIDALAEVDTAYSVVFDVLNRISVCLDCAPGSQTRVKVGSLSNELVAMLNNLNQVLDKATKSPKSPVIVTHEGTDALAKYCNNVRIAANRFATEEKHTVIAEQNLRGALGQAIEAVKHEKAEIKRRGQQRDPAFEYVGQLAAEYPEPKKGEKWMIGQAIYLKLRQSAQQMTLADPAKTALEYLSRYFVGDHIDKTGLGTWVYGARTTYLKRHSHSSNLITRVATP